MRTIDKAFAYITHERRLLVFAHVGIPAAGIQVPAGTVKGGESPMAATLREATEETGLDQFGPAKALGVCDFDLRPFGKDEVHRRHFFHLPLVSPPTERWQHYEMHPDSNGMAPTLFELYWVQLPDGAADLSPGHGAFLPQLCAEVG